LCGNLTGYRDSETEDMIKALILEDAQQSESPSRAVETIVNLRKRCYL